MGYMKRIHALILTIAIIILVVMMPPFGFSYPLSNTNGECEECHSEFEAFAVIIDAPREVPEDYDFEYKIIVRNHGEHSVQDLSAIIDLSDAPNLEAALGGEPYHDEISGSVSFGSVESYTFPILEGASSAVIILDGDEGLLGRNDIDLFVEGPSGDVWESTSPGADEGVNLNANTLRRSGAGDYTARVEYFIGSPSVSFTLTIDVEYSMNQIYLPGSDLAQGEKYTFVLPLKSKAKGENTITTVVTGTAYYEHGDDEPSASDSHEYTDEKSSDLKVGDRYVYNPPSEDFEVSINIILLERITGMLSALLLILSIGLCGYFRPINSRIEKILGGKASRVKWHCRGSLLLLLLSLIHGILLPFSPHASSLRGLIPGTIAFIFLSLLGYVGWQQKTLIQRWGPEKWRRIHLLLTLIIIFIVIAHAIMDGSDFSWLR
jgi:hypothetical protein